MYSTSLVLTFDPFLGPSFSLLFTHPLVHFCTLKLFPQVILANCSLTKNCSPSMMAASSGVKRSAGGRDSVAIAVVVAVVVPDAEDSGDAAAEEVEGAGCNGRTGFVMFSSICKMWPLHKNENSNRTLWLCLVAFNDNPSTVSLLGPVLRQG